MRIVFVGGTRFIGHHAAAAARARGHDVVVMHRGKHPCELGGVEEVVVDRGDPSALATAVARARADVVVDTLAMTRADAETVTLAARIAATRLVVLSSQDVYAAFGAVLGHPAPPPAGELDEDAPLTPVEHPYRGRGHDGGDDYDKKHVEAVVAAAGLPATILRLPAVYGPRDYRRRFGDEIDALDLGREVVCRGGFDWRWTHAEVRDVAHAIVLAAERPAGPPRAYNVGEAVTPTMRARIEAIAAAIGVTPRWAPPPARYPDVVVSSARIRGELGFAEVTTEAQRLADLVAACRATRLRIVS